MRFTTRHRIPLLLILLAASIAPALAQSSTPPQEGLLSPAETAKILPGAVFFRGQSATTQTRNSGGIRFADAFLVLATLVDNSGYSTGIQDKYQAYFITEVPLDFHGNTLQPGAYGVGILKTASVPQFTVMDIGAHDLFTTGAVNDAKFHRPTPLQLLAGEAPGKYRLYFGRNYVEFSRTK